MSPSTGPDPAVSRETPGRPGPVPAAPVLPAWLGPSEAPLAQYAALLATDGVERGLLGPREVPRLWDRHLLNCAVVADPALGLVPTGARVADIGSGAGLPGLVWALARPDLSVVLVEPLLRRARFLGEVVTALGVQARVEVRRARAEDLAGGLADVVTARAVAPLDRLAVWTVPLVRVGGVLLALKGASAEEEVDVARPVLAARGITAVDVVRCGVGVVDPPTTVVRAVRGAAGSAVAGPDRSARERRRTR